MTRAGWRPPHVVEVERARRTRRRLRPVLETRCGDVVRCAGCSELV